ncbi:tRNA-yW synthesizing protein 1-like protein [Zopfochytrium polystomum]|nr:tRNA-yW synthesizing protein 1-like protein [Zopfochytrium polystomum]
MTTAAPAASRTTATVTAAAFLLATGAAVVVAIAVATSTASSRRSSPSPASDGGGATRSQDRPTNKHRRRRVKSNKDDHGNDRAVVRSSAQSVMDSLVRRFTSLLSLAVHSPPPAVSSISIVYSTTDGSTKKLATTVFQKFLSSNLDPSVSVHLIHIAELDRGASIEDTAGANKDYLLDKLAGPNSRVCFLLPTAEGGTAPADAAWFFAWLEDARFDFRVPKSAFETLRFSVFGIGDSAYPREHVCGFSKRVDRYLRAMGAKEFRSCVFADLSAEDFADSFQQWADSVVELCTRASDSQRATVEKAAADAADVRDKEAEEDEEDGFSDDGADESALLPLEGDAESEAVLDLEDLGNVASGIAAARATRKDTSEEGCVAIVSGKRSRPAKRKLDLSEMTREMITPNLRKNLEKQGYKLIGSHSGVKMCRWTKSQLRGRGGCYKHTFYGIESHRCMETTPSLACANKCVFCWRHQTNPVGTEWRWKADSALEIVEGALEKHRNMIKQMKGVPGVSPEKFQEGLAVAHCALSLVGEPIMYPYINEFVDLLHERSISSFLVTNAQFPELIRDMKPVTQLYVSIDAGNKDSLKQIDRPIFGDYWERFLKCMDEIAKKKERTVFRLTLVKGFNIEDLDDYAKLIKRGNPDFVEVKGVTFCGFGDSNPLTMSNVPFHDEVANFVRTLCEKVSDEYEIACEHAHSCSLLIAHKRFRINGTWHTWIDYPRFHQLARAGKPFTAMDYLAETPAWAVYGADERGFDPGMTRVYRAKAKYDEAGGAEEYKAKVQAEKSGAASGTAAVAAV